MKVTSKTANGVAAIRMGGVVAAGLWFLGAAAGSAQAAELTVEYECPFPLIGPQPIIADIHANLPTTIEVGQASGRIKVNVTATVGEAATEGLNLVKAATLEGVTRATAMVDAPKYDVPIELTLEIPKTPIPESGAFDLQLVGETPSLTFIQPGTAVVNVGTISMTLTPREADGDETALATFISDCTLPGKQNTVLGTGEIVPAGKIKGPGKTATPPPATTETARPVPPTAAAEPMQQPAPAARLTKVAAVAAPAQARDDEPLALSYRVDGGSHVKNLDADLPLTGSLDTLVDVASSTFKGDLSLDDSTLSFWLFYFLPAKARVRVDDVGGTFGTITGGAVAATSIVSIVLKNVSVLGLPLVWDSDTCQTVGTTTVELTSGPNFSVLKGGTLSGEYTIPEFTGCGLTTPITSWITSGPGNTIKIEIARK